MLPRKPESFPESWSALLQKFMSVTSALLVAMAMALGGPAVAGAAGGSALDTRGVVRAPSRTQVTYLDTKTGKTTGTANQWQPRPGLSLVKLYIADYVLAHGDADDFSTAMRMIRTSDDVLANELYRKYPKSIQTTADYYHLGSTRGARRWGYSMTSTADAVKYLRALRSEDPDSPILEAMAQTTPIAADGYHQDYGTALLPGVTGTKFGWSNDRESVHATISYGEGFIVAAITLGDADELSDDVMDAFGLGDGKPYYAPKPPKDDRDAGDDEADAEDPDDAEEPGESEGAGGPDQSAAAVPDPRGASAPVPGPQRPSAPSPAPEPAPASRPAPSLAPVPVRQPLQDRVGREIAGPISAPALPPARALTLEPISA